MFFSKNSCMIYSRSPCKFRKLKRRNPYIFSQHLTFSSPVKKTIIQENPIGQKKKCKIYSVEKDGLRLRISSIGSQHEMGDRGSSSSESKVNTFQSIIDKYVITYFLPANYPGSVEHGYGRFASLCFCASIAGSASMVLSTQTLLLAVGIVGQGTSASIMAGALNWVLKDGIGQLGGVWFASFMGRATSQFDANPKYWRMVAAISLDAATLLEITSPLVPASWVLPIASIANVGKNIGFLTASASRAALHQAVSKKGNLGDVTAKAGSQSMAASLIGTSIGIGMSPFLGDIPNFIMGFVGLSIIHQSCNYLSLKAVPLAHFNMNRLDLVLRKFVQSNSTVMSPIDVAAEESFLPIPIQRNTNKTHQQWLKIGSTLQLLCGPEELKEILENNNATGDKSYMLLYRDNIYHLVFMENATGLEVLQGMHHVYWLQYNNKPGEFNINSHDYSESMHESFKEFTIELREKGWNLDLVRVEPINAVRLKILEEI